jgi:hypothetical protein
VDVLKRAESFPRTEATREWREALDHIASWTVDLASGFAAHAESVEPGDEESVVAELSEDHLQGIADRFPDEWDRIAMAYCDWAKGGFAFRFCDIVVGRLETIFHADKSSLDVRAAALVSAAALGAVHNRWFVMRRVMRLADARLNESLAERIAIEIRAGDAAGHFLQCAEAINRSTSDYHPRIAESLVADHR